MNAEPVVLSNWLPDAAKENARQTRGSPDLLCLLFNDHGNAGRLISMYGEEIRYCHAMKKWLAWDGMRWAVDDTDQSRRLAKQAMLEFLRQAIDTKNDAAEKF